MNLKKRCKSIMESHNSEKAIQLKNCKLMMNQRPELDKGENDTYIVMSNTDGKDILRGVLLVL